MPCRLSVTSSFPERERCEKEDYEEETGAMAATATASGGSGCGGY